MFEADGIQIASFMAPSMAVGRRGNTTLIEIPVHYNGEDLAEVAQIWASRAPIEVVQPRTRAASTPWPSPALRPALRT
jgi:allophanate hydrolase subunit 1